MPIFRSGLPNDREIDPIAVCLALMAQRKRGK